MRVLLWLEAGYHEIPGGHRVQADRTAEALRALGADVSLVFGPDADLDGADVVHGIGPEASWIRRARLLGIPVALSTIYVSREYFFRPRRRWSERVELNARLGYSVLRRGAHETAIRVLEPALSKQLAFETADRLLPNSESEARAIRDELGVSTPISVVPNAVDHRLFVPPPDDSQRDGVLYVGRIEPHKNQLRLIQALKGTGVQLTLVGAMHPHHAAYYQECQRAADGNVEFLEARDQAELVSLYQRAAVHAMPSLFETTGLTSLEAALCDAAIVTTDRGYVRDYFESDVHYCDPEDAGSIRDAVLVALTTGACRRLRERILSRYTWDHTAGTTLEAYEAMLTAASRRKATT
jgi:glycosyltransferase involved in cell wall biosynthesis